MVGCRGLDPLQRPEHLAYRRPLQLRPGFPVAGLL